MSERIRRELERGRDGTGALVAAAVIGVPALVFRGGRSSACGREQVLPLPHRTGRQRLDRRRRWPLAAIRELAFEAAAGHVSGYDFARFVTATKARPRRSDELDRGPGRAAAPRIPAREG